MSDTNRPPEIDGAPASEQNIASFATSWIDSIRSRLHVATELVVAEAKLAVIGLGLIIFMAVLAAILLTCAWALVVVAVVDGLLKTGAQLWVVLLALATAHVLMALVLGLRALKMSEKLKFSETRRHISQSHEPSA